jgi:hypothetical protein
MAGWEGGAKPRHDLGAEQPEAATGGVGGKRSQLEQPEQVSWPEAMQVLGQTLRHRLG